MTDTSAIPDTVLAALAGKAYLTVPQLAKAGNIDPKTIRRHIDDGVLPWRHHGRLGALRIRRVFTRDDLEAYYRATRGKSCQSTSTATRLIGSSISSATVIDFPARPKSLKAGRSVKRKPSRRKSVGRPSDYLKKLGVPAGSL